jgi:hypothetical protein
LREQRVVALGQERDGRRAFGRGRVVAEQVGPGRYAGSIRAEDPGAYLVRIAQTFESPGFTDAASRTLGVVSPAAEEYRRLGVDPEALAAYASAGGGRQLVLADEESGEAVWAHDIAAGAFPTPIWPWLLILAIVLVPLDVGVRRVALARSDARRARAWLARRLGLGTVQPEAVPGLAELRAARGRSQRRAERVVDRQRPAPRTEPSPSAAPEPAAESPAVDTPGGGETLAERLARRRRGS